MTKDKDCTEHHYKRSGSFKSGDISYELQRCWLCSKPRVVMVDEIATVSAIILDSTDLSRLKEIQKDLNVSVELLKHIDFECMKGDMPYAVKSSYFNLREVVGDLDCIINELNKDITKG